MKKILIPIISIFFIFFINCAGKVYVTNSTFAEIKCELASSSSIVGNNNIITLVAGDTEKEVVTKKYTTSDKLILYFWADGSAEWNQSEAFTILKNSVNTNQTFWINNYYLEVSKKDKIVFPSVIDGSECIPVISTNK